MNRFLPREIPDTARSRRELAAVRRAAQRYETQPIRALTFSRYRIYFDTGSRVEYEADYIDHRRRLNVYTAMALTDPDARWLRGLEDILWAICDEYTWAFPAHIEHFESIEDSVTTVDLFASETSQALSEACSLQAARLSPTVLHRVEYEVRRRVLTPYTNRELTFGRDNWSAVCAGCVGMAMMYWGSPAEFEAIRHKLLSSMDTFLSGYEDDGCCLEGALYWAYGFGYFCYFSQMLRQYTQGRIDLLHSEKAAKIAAFRQTVCLEKDVVVPFADAPHNYAPHAGLLAFLSREYGTQPPDEAHTSGFDEDIRHRFADFIRDFFWTGEGAEPGQEADALTVFPSSQWYIQKGSEYSFAAKGGRNNEPHNHNDLGSFILYADGAFILDDLGWPEYDGSYFGPGRYANLCASSRGHSVPLLGGHEQQCGREHCARMPLAQAGRLTLELAKAYPEGACAQFERTFCLDAHGVRITDHVCGAHGELRERFVTRQKPEVCAGGARIGAWELVCLTGAPAVQLSQQTFMPRLSICKMDMKPVETAYLIDFCFAAADEYTVRFAIQKTSFTGKN